MIEVQHTLVQEDVIAKNFVCNLNRCKGACCIEGDSGAPLEQKEVAILEEIYPYVKPYMTVEGIEAMRSRLTVNAGKRLCHLGKWHYQVCN